MTIGWGLGLCYTGQKCSKRDVWSNSCTLPTVYLKPCNHMQLNQAKLWVHVRRRWRLFGRLKRSSTTKLWHVAAQPFVSRQSVAWLDQDAWLAWDDASTLYRALHLDYICQVCQGAHSEAITIETEEARPCRSKLDSPKHLKGPKFWEELGISNDFVWVTPKHHAFFRCRDCQDVTPEAAMEVLKSAPGVEVELGRTFMDQDEVSKPFVFLRISSCWACLTCIRVTYKSLCTCISKSLSNLGQGRLKSRNDRQQWKSSTPATFQSENNKIQRQAARGLLFFHVDRKQNSGFKICLLCLLLFLHTVRWWIIHLRRCYLASLRRMSGALNRKGTNTIFPI